MKRNCMYIWEMVITIQAIKTEKTFVVQILFFLKKVGNYVFLLGYNGEDGMQKEIVCAIGI